MITVSNVNDAPTISGVPDQPATEDIDLELNVTPYIGDVDNELDTLIITEDSEHATVDGQIITFNYPNGILEENVTITVSDGSLTDEQQIAVTVTPVNDAPIIDSAITPINILEGEYKVINLDDYVSDIDNDDDEITWSRTPPTNLVVGIDNVARVMNVSAFEETWSGSETFNLTADDSGAVENTDTETITVNVQSILSFSNLVITIDGDDNPAENGDEVGDASPDSTFSLSVNLNNNYPEIEQWVEEITVTARLDSTIDDETEVSPPFTLDGSKSSTEELIFNKLPLTIEEGSYILTLTAQGTDYKEVVRQVEWTVDVRYLTENREIRFMGIELSNEELSCYRETVLNVSLVNTGEANQNVNLAIENDDFGISNSSWVYIVAKDTVDTLYTIELFEAPAAGTYPITINVEYDDGEGEYTALPERTADLVISDCIDVEDQSIEEDSTETLEIDLTDYVDDPILDDGDFTYDIEDESNTELIECEIVSMTLTCADPVADQNGYSDIEVSVTSGSYVSYDTFRLTVEPVNDAPEIDVTIPDVTFDEGETDSSIDLDDHVSDIDNDDSELDWEASGNTEITVTISNGHVVTFGTSDENWYGSETITLTVDDEGFTDSQDVLVTVNQLFDDFPYISAAPDVIEPYLLIGDDVPTEFEITVTNPDDMDYLITWYVGLDEVESDTDVYSFEKSENGIYELSVELTDLSGDEPYDSRSWDIRVTTTPVTDYDGTIRDVNESNVDAFSGLTIFNEFAKIDFGEQVIDLSEVVDVDANVELRQGVAGINTNIVGFDIFEDYGATITMYDLEYESTPEIYYNDGFETTGTDVCDGDSNPACTNIKYNETTDTLVFDVSHFTIFFLPVPNLAPTITSSPVTSAIIDEPYSYDVEATDPESDTLTYALTTKPNGMSIGGSDGVITWTPTNISDEDVTVTVTDTSSNTDTQSFTISVSEGSRLEISDLDIKVGDEKEKDLQNGDKIGEKARPGDKVKFDIEVKSLFPRSSDIEIDDINIEVIIKDIDDGDNLEGDEDIENDLDPGDDDSVTIEFEIPLLVKDDTYDVEIFVDAEDEKGNDHDIRWDLTLEVKKDKHELLISDADLSPSLVRCNRNPSLDIEVINIGREDEDDVTIEITNYELGLDIEETDIELEEGDSDDSVFDKTYRLSIDDDVKSGTYPITIRAYYDNRESDEETVDLVVEKCVEAKVVTSVETGPVELITTTPTITEPIAPVTKISFRDTTEYLALLVILFVILLGGLIFAIGAMVITAKKR